MVVVVDAAMSLFYLTGRLGLGVAPPMVAPMVASVVYSIDVLGSAARLWYLRGCQRMPYVVLYKAYDVWYRIYGVW